MGSWGAWTVCAFDFCIYNLVLTDIAEFYQISTTKAVWLITLTLVARLFGGTLGGMLTDRFGARRVLVAALLWVGGCNAAIAVAPTFGHVSLLRALFGVGMGATWTACATLATSQLSATRRGIGSGVMQSGWAAGYFIAAAVTPALAGRFAWQAVYACSAILSVCVSVLFLFAPQGQKNASTVHIQLEHGSTHNQPTLAAWIWALSFLSLAFVQYYALFALFPTLVASQRGDYQNHVLFYALGMLMGTPLQGVAVARLPAKWVVATSCVLAVGAAPFYLGLAEGGMSSGAFVVGLTSGGLAGVTPYLLDHLFPRRTRGRDFGIVYNAAAFVTSVVPAAIASVAHTSNNGTALAMYVVAAVGLSGCGVAMFFFARVVAGTRSCSDDTLPSIASE